MVHPNGSRRGHESDRGLVSGPSSGFEWVTLTPVVVADWGGVAGVSAVSLASRVVSSGGST